ncbi:hypothetical protein LTS17_004154 [Exophiala oligosperma]
MSAPPAELVPECNSNCWFCGYHNLSNTIQCRRCQAVTIPARRGNEILEWTVRSFDPFATTFNSAHASEFFALIKALDDQDSVAIKVGVRLRYAPYQVLPDYVRDPRYRYPAVMIVKSPGLGKHFTVCGPAQDAAYQTARTTTLNTMRLDDSIGAGHAFWESLNQVLDLDIHFPI